MLFTLNPSSGVPLYLQLENQLKHAAAAGAISPGESLPSVRKLAAQLRINPNTVARAYQDLERDGVIRMVPGGGTYLAERQPTLLRAEKLRRLRPLARQIAVEGTQLMLSHNDVLKIIQEELEELEEAYDRQCHLD
jgi:GntR family transcriptional regulator